MIKHHFISIDTDSLKKHSQLVDENLSLLSKEYQSKKDILTLSDIIDIIENEFKINNINNIKEKEIELSVTNGIIQFLKRNSIKYNEINNKEQIKFKKNINLEKLWNALKTNIYYISKFDARNNISTLKTFQIKTIKDPTIIVKDKNNYFITDKSFIKESWIIREGEEK